MSHVMDEGMKMVRDQILEFMVELINAGTEQDNGRQLHTAGTLGIVASAIQHGLEKELEDTVRAWGQRHLVSWRSPAELPK